MSEETIVKRGLHLQARDLKLLLELGEVGILDTDTIHARYFSDDNSGRACRRRLRLYASHGLTQPVQVPVSRTARAGRLPLLHRLTVAGAELVTEETGIRLLRPVRSDLPKPFTLLHRLGMAKVQLAVNDACRLQSLPKPEWILEYDAHRSVPAKARLSQRFQLCHEFTQPDGTRVKCWPDAACLLTIPKENEQWRLALLWEYDRATETHVQLSEKAPGYSALIQTEKWRQIFPSAQGVRIFFVVPSPERLNNCLKTFRAVAVGNLFRFAVACDVAPEKFLSAPIWHTTTGESRAILRVTKA